MADRRFIKKPNVYDYHDYRQFLKAWLSYKKKAEPGFSLRALAQRTQISLGYLNMVTKSERSLSQKTLIKLLPELKLTASEAKYFKCILTLADSTTQEERLDALKKMQRYQTYKKKNTDEAVVYQYLSDWLNVAIRELTLTKGAVIDSQWIQKKLKHKASIKEINRSIKFLLENEFLKERNGRIIPEQERLKCEAMIHKLGLTEFHKKMFQLAIQAIDNTVSDDRWITGYTFPVNKEQFEQIKNILIEAKDKMTKLPQNPDTNNIVYHTAFVAFPLTQNDEE